MLSLNSIDELKNYIGKTTGISPWIDVTQKRINEFAEVTEDFNWIHIDEDKAKEGPFGSTIAHGFLTLSLAPWMGYNTYKVKNIAHSVNYGLDRVRFLSPVKAGSKVRGNYKLLEVQEFKGNGYRVKNELTIEIQNKERPACVAETIGVLYPQD
jgi:acyl dehydratase